MKLTLCNLVKVATSPVACALKECQAKIGGYNINYVKVGHGSHSVVCIPGAIGTITSHFGYQIKGFNKEKFTLVILDPPGHGKSYPPDRVLDRKSFERDADTAYELMKYLNIPKYSCMGWCAGGTASMILAGKYPHALHKLVVWSTKAILLKADIESYRAIRDVSTWIEEQLRKDMIETYGEKGFAKFWANWVNRMTSELEKNPDVCVDLLKNITCPTFILQGQKDRLVDPSHFPFLCYHIKHSIYHLYPEGKHDIHMGYAEDFNRRVQEFLLEE